MIGGGHAAGQAVASLRQDGFDGEIDVVGDEPHLPYQRPPLSKQYLSGEHGVDRVHLRAAAFYEERKINLYLGVRAETIDPKAHTVALVDRQNAAATTNCCSRPAAARGSSTFPAAICKGIYYLRTLADVDAIRAEFAPGKRIVIAGGGYVGLEVAAVAVTAGLAVTVIEMEDRILKRVTTPAMSAFYHDLHTGRGVAIRTSTKVSGFEGTRSCRIGRHRIGRTDSDRSRDRRHRHHPEHRTRRRRGHRMRQRHPRRRSLPHVRPGHLCCGRLHESSRTDCSGAGCGWKACRTRWNRRACATANMNGGDATYASIPWFWSDQYELKLQMAGFSSDGDVAVMRGDPATNQFATFYLKDGVIVAVDAVNSPREFMACRQMVDKRSKPDPAKLADPKVALKELI